jgi:hypothetical protein
VTVALSAAGPTHLDALQAVRSDDLDLPSGPGSPWPGVLVLLRLLSVLLASAGGDAAGPAPEPRPGGPRGHPQPAAAGAPRRRARPAPRLLPAGAAAAGRALQRGPGAAARGRGARGAGARGGPRRPAARLVVLPFVALRATFPGLRGVRTAVAEVGLLVEMLADDRAARRTRGRCSPVRSTRSAAAPSPPAASAPQAVRCCCAPSGCSSPRRPSPCATRLAVAGGHGRRPGPGAARSAAAAARVPLKITVGARRRAVGTPAWQR